MNLQQSLPRAILIVFALYVSYLGYNAIANPDIQLSESRPPGLKDKVAVIVENRQSPSIVPHILHFSSVLGPEWPVLLFTSNSFINSIPSMAFKRMVETQHIQIIDLPDDIYFNNHRDVSAFLTKPWFWRQLKPAKHVLFFQLDSIICSNSPYTADNFTKFDIIGAPIKTASGWGKGFNLGLSIRNIDICCRIVEENDWEEEVRAKDTLPPYDNSLDGDIFPDNPNEPRIEYEDQWFFRKMIELRHSGFRINLPSVEMAKRFSADSIWHDKSFGYHKPKEQSLEKLNHLEESCPEYHLSTSDGFPTSE